MYFHLLLFLKLVVTLRFEEAMKLIRVLQNKQIQVNEILNVSLKEFDETLSLVNKAKDQFKGEVELANKRLLIYNSDYTQIKNHSKLLLVNFCGHLCYSLCQLTSYNN